MITKSGLIATYPQTAHFSLRAVALLLVLADDGEMLTRDIVATLGNVPDPDVSLMLNRLERRGFVKRRRDGVLSYAAITAVGRKFVERLGR